MSNEKFCLRWNDFETNISDAFRELREDKDFFDVTLACENEQIQAHKVILSACSSFFRNILRRNVHQHPLVYLKGVKFGDLQAVLNFMYQGEVSVAQEELNSFLAVAEDLRVKGLTQNHSESQKSVSNENPPKPPKPSPYKTTPSNHVPREPMLPPVKRQKQFASVSSAPHNYSTPTTAADDDDDIQEVAPVSVKSEPGDLSGHSSSGPVQDIFSHGLESQAVTTLDYQEENYDDYEQEYQEHHQYKAGEGAGEHDQIKGSQFQDPSELLQFVTRSQADGKFHCTLCDKFSHQNSSCTRNHVESQHYPNVFSYPCDLCDQTFDSRNKFNNHKQSRHKKVKPYH